jgi:hypothetical protein
MQKRTIKKNHLFFRTCLHGASCAVVDAHDAVAIDGGVRR